MDALYTQIDKDPTAEEADRRHHQAAKISVEVDGDTATVSWSAQVNGPTRPSRRRPARSTASGSSST